MSFIGHIIDLNLVSNPGVPAYGIAVIFSPGGTPESVQVTTDDPTMLSALFLAAATRIELEVEYTETGDANVLFRIHLSNMG